MPNPNVSCAPTCHTIFLPSFVGGGAGAVHLTNRSRLANAEVKAAAPRRAKTGGFWYEIKRLFNYGVNSISSHVRQGYATETIESSVKKFVEEMAASAKNQSGRSISECLEKLKLQVAGLYDEDVFSRSVLHAISNLDSSTCEKIESEIFKFVEENGASEILSNVRGCISNRRSQAKSLLDGIDQILNLSCQAPEVTRVDFLLEKVNGFDGFQKHGICASEVADYIFNSGKLKLYELDYLCRPEQHQVPLKDRPENWGVLFYEKAKIKKAEEVKKAAILAVEKNVSDILGILADERSVNFFSTASTTISSKIIEIAKIANSTDDFTCSNLEDLISDFFLFKVNVADRKKCEDILQSKLVIDSNLKEEVENRVRDDMQTELKNGKNRFEFNPMKIANPVDPSNVAASFFNAFGMR